MRRAPLAARQPVAQRPWETDSETVVPPPFALAAWVEARRTQLRQGRTLPLFGDGHPDGEFSVLVAGGAATSRTVGDGALPVETWLYQLEGSCMVKVGVSSPVVLESGCCCTLPKGCVANVVRAEGSVGLVISNNPAGNRTG